MLLNDSVFIKEIDLVTSYLEEHIVENIIKNEYENIKVDFINLNKQVTRLSNAIIAINHKKYKLPIDNGKALALSYSFLEQAVFDINIFENNNHIVIQDWLSSTLDIMPDVIKIDVSDKFMELNIKDRLINLLLDVIANTDILSDMILVYNSLNINDNFTTVIPIKWTNKLLKILIVH